jgi:hypothetical protein
MYNGNGPSDIVQGGDFRHKASDSEFVTKDSTLWSMFLV